MNPFSLKLEKAEAVEVNQLDSAARPPLYRNRLKLLLWLAGAISIFILFYCSSYLSLLWLPPYDGNDMKSQLTADYGHWDVLQFQPVDPAIIEEVKKERGLPEQMILNGQSGSTQAGSNALTVHGATSTPQPTQENSFPGQSPSLSPLIPTSMQTDIITTPLPPSTDDAASQPTQATNPTKQGKSPKTKKTPKPHNTPKP